MGKIASSRTKNSSGIMDWFNHRLPVTQFYKDHLSEYYAPKNFNFWYFSVLWPYWYWSIRLLPEFG